VIELAANQRVEAVDFGAQRLGIEIERARAQAREGRVEEAQDVAGVVRYDGLPLLVPEHGQGGAAAVAGRRQAVELGQLLNEEVLAEGAAFLGGKAPAFRAQVGAR